MKFFFIFFCVYLPMLLFSQEEIINHSWNNEWIIPFRPGEKEYEPGNAILLELANDRDMSPYRVVIGMRFREEMAFRSLPMQPPEITFFISALEPFGDLTYRGFPLDSALMPATFSCYLNLIELPDSVVMKKYHLRGLSIAQLQTGYTSTDIPVFEAGKWSVTLSDETFFFTETMVKGFKERLSLINDYYAAAAIADSLLSLAKGYDPLSYDDLPEKFLLLVEINKMVQLINRRQIDALLHLDKFDPACFQAKFRKLDLFSRSATMTFMDQLSTGRAISWDGLTDRLSQAFIDRLVWYIRQSMLLNGIRGGIYNAYLNNWFDFPAFQNDSVVFQILVDLMYPGQTREEQLNGIARSVWAAYARVAVDLMEENRHVEALSLLNHRDALRVACPFMYSLTDERLLKSRAANGVFASYLGIAETCIGLHKTEWAGIYLEKAMDYHRVNPGIIMPDTLLQRVFRQFFSAQLQVCDGYFSARNFQDAIDCYTVFEYNVPDDMKMFLSGHLKERREKAWEALFFSAHAETFQQMKHNNEAAALVSFDRAIAILENITMDGLVKLALDELNALMLPVCYRQLEEKGIQQYYQYKMEEAYQTFSALKELALKVGMTPDSTVDQMYQESHKYHMLNEISMATSMIWNDQFEEAREYVRQVESVMGLYCIDTDTVLRQAIEGYKSKIDRKVCMNLLEEVTTLASRSFLNIEQRRFDVAVKQLGEACMLAINHPTCDIPVFALTDTLQKYWPAAFYQEKLEDARRQAVMGNYQSALQLFGDNERFFQRQALIALGVSSISLLDFVRQTKRIPLTLLVAYHLLEIEDASGAWSCLTILMVEGVVAKEVRELQEAVGAALASDDYPLNREATPEMMVKNYTGGNRWFVNFAKAYATRWKLLQSP